MNDMAAPTPRPKKSVALSGIVAGNTALCTVGRSGNDLHYRGYDILDIADVCEFEEIAYLLVHGKLPNVAELEGYKAKLIVLMLGTNNISRKNSNDEIVEGDRLIVEEFRKRQPQAKVLILGIFPRAVQPTDPYRASIKDINSKLAKLADNKNVFFMDIGDKFLTSDGTLTPEIMPDALHPNFRGYQIWADAISSRVRQLMR